MAWHIEALHRTKKLPSLEKLLGRATPERAPKAQSEDEMLTAMLAWVAATNAQ